MTRKAPRLEDWWIETSWFDKPVVRGTDKGGVHRVAALLWWSDGRFGTDAGIFLQGRERGADAPPRTLRSALEHVVKERAKLGIDAGDE